MLPPVLAACHISTHYQSIKAPLSIRTLPLGLYNQSSLILGITLL